MLTLGECLKKCLDLVYTRECYTVEFGGQHLQYQCRLFSGECEPEDLGVHTSNIYILGGTIDYRTQTKENLGEYKPV